MLAGQSRAFKMRILA